LPRPGENTLTNTRGYRQNNWNCQAGLLVIAILLMLAGFASGATACTRQGDSKRSEELNGPYKVTGQVDQTSPDSGIVLVTATVTERATNAPVSDAKVRILRARAGADDQRWTFATLAPQIPGRYEARLGLEGTGTWNLSVEVIGPLGRVTESLPSTTVQERQTSLAGVVVFVIVFVVLVLGAVYVWWSARRELRKREAASARRGSSS
jgi:hypothetical protein